MTTGAFDPSFEILPGTLPIFPLTGALLLPRSRLPLNIFEPRYIAMVEGSLAADRMVGMIQPRGPENTGQTPPIFETGCAGRISSFTETEDGRFVIILTGVCRFDVASELAVETLYRQVAPRWDRFRDDLEETPDGTINRERVLLTVNGYLEARQIEADWQAVERSGDEDLINTLAMSCPFDPTEKQALLEASSLNERTRLLVSLMEMAVVSAGDETTSPH